MKPEATPSHRYDRDDIHGSPWVGLAYLLFLLLPLVFWRDRPTSAIVASVVAIVLFVPAYFASYRVTGWRQVALILFVAALAYGVIPYNPGGNTFVIYALAMAAVALPERTAIWLSAVLFAVMAVEFWWVVPSPVLALGSVSVVAVIGTMVVASILYARARGRRNAELRLTQDEVRRLATVAERERIGRDLHDLLGHTLSVVALKSELAGKLLDRDRDPAAARAQIREVEDVARQALAQVREAVAGIRAAGFQAELAAARLALLSAEVRLDQRLAPVEVTGPVESVLAMTLREAVTNVLRHAAASRVEVELGEDGRHWRLAIADDGRGGIESHGNGLAGMRERLVAIGGTLDIDSPPGAGTRLLVRVPRESKR